jgi:uncharacterized tellurite resistance protein B-like protein
MMSRPTFALDLAKLVVAAAWADGEVHHEEVNTLKRLVLTIPEFTHADWHELDLYLDHPVSDDERDALLRNVVAHIGSEADKRLVLETLRRLVEADGVVTPEESEMLATVEAAVGEQPTGLLGALAGLFSRAGRSLRAGGRSRVREDGLDDFLRNPVYYRLAHEGPPPDIGDDALRVACLVAGLMAAAAHADRNIAEAEARLVAKGLAADWSLPLATARRVAELALERVHRGLDVFRLGNELRDLLGEDQRRHLMESLYRIGRADSGLSHEEELRLKEIGKCLGLSHRHIMSAKAATR